MSLMRPPKALSVRKWFANCRQKHVSRSFDALSVSQGVILFRGFIFGLVLKTCGPVGSVSGFGVLFCDTVLRRTSVKSVLIKSYESYVRQLISYAESTDVAACTVVCPHTRKQGNENMVEPHCYICITIIVNCS